MDNKINCNNCVSLYLCKLINNRIINSVVSNSAIKI